MLSTWLLPVVPLVVSSTTGMLVARAILPVSPEHALISVVVSTISLMTGLSLSFMIINVYLLRLMMYGLPPKGFIVSKFLPLGPLGQVNRLLSPTKCGLSICLGWDCIYPHC